MFALSGCLFEDRRPWIVRWAAAVVGLALLAGCGTTKMQEATEQLLLSEAVDQSISAIDFRPLSGQKVFLDTTYIRQIKSLGFVNSDYVTSSLRQQVLAAGCLLQESPAEADIIIEARVGTLGADAHQMTYGIPPNSTVSNAAKLVPGGQAIPAIPELSLARRETHEGAAKIAAFAFDRKTRAPLWQSGISEASATAKDTWVLGMGPFQDGSIRKGTRLAGSPLEFGSIEPTEPVAPPETFTDAPIDYTAEVKFDELLELLEQEKQQQAKLARGETDAQTAPETGVRQAGASTEAAAK